MIKVDYTYNLARTLGPEDLGTHPDGWTIEGKVVEDYYQWVNDFEATHPELGFVRGDFEDEIEASSQEALDHFLEHHPYTEWDYYDI